MPMTLVQSTGQVLTSYSNTSPPTWVSLAELKENTPMLYKKLGEKDAELSATADEILARQQSSRPAPATVIQDDLDRLFEPREA